MAEEETPKGERESTSEKEVKTYTADEVQAMIEKETGGLKAKVDELLSETKTAKQKAREAAEKAAKEAEEKARASGDVEALEKSWTEKFTKTTEELTSQLSEKDQIIASLTAGNAAKTLASKLAVKGSESLLERVISDRLGVEVVEGQPKVIVKDAQGQRSALTMEDLEKELRGDTALKPILAGTQATGPGGTGSRSGSSGAVTKVNLGGTKEERVAALRERFPDLN